MATRTRWRLALAAALAVLALAATFRPARSGEQGGLASASFSTGRATVALEGLPPLATDLRVMQCPGDVVSGPFDRCTPATPLIIDAHGYAEIDTVLAHPRLVLVRDGGRVVLSMPLDESGGQARLADGVGQDVVVVVRPGAPVTTGGTTVPPTTTPTTAAPTTVPGTIPVTGPSGGVAGGGQAPPLAYTGPATTALLVGFGLACLDLGYLALSSTRPGRRVGLPRAGPGVARRAR